MTVLREPFLHFSLLGLLLFLLYSVIPRDDSAMDNRIVVDANRIRHLSARFEQIWQRPPAPDELKTLIDEYVLEEILYRQALALGLDKDDSVIRRHLRQKMEYLSLQAMQIPEPDEGTLQAHLDAYPERFRQDAVFQFEQFYFREEQDPDHLARRIAAATSAVTRGEQPNSDPSLLPTSFDALTETDIRQQFGPDFATALRGLPLHEWSPPLRSGLGVHLVRITARQEGIYPTLAAIRDAVRSDWVAVQQQQMKQNMRNEWLKQYQVDIVATATVSGS